MNNLQSLVQNIPNQETIDEENSENIPVKQALAMLENYHNKRMSEKNHTRSIFGCNKHEKLAATNAVIALIKRLANEGKGNNLAAALRESIGELIAHDKALNQGDLGNIFKAILQMEGKQASPSLRK
jgi:hypothetical protein